MVYSCDSCSRTFDREWNYKRHRDMVHKNGEDAASESSEAEENEQTDGVVEHEEWRHVIGSTLEGEEFSYDPPEQVLREPHLSEFIAALRLVVESKMKFANYMKKADNVYRSIVRCAERHVENECTADEANETAWNDRRFAIRKILKDNIDLFGDDDDDNNNDNT